MTLNDSDFQLLLNISFVTTVRALERIVIGNPGL